jgi:hypothetical protein
VFECKELIPVREVIEASVKAAKSRAEPLVVDIDTREKIAIDAPRSLLNLVPYNLRFRMSTAIEAWTSPHFRHHPPEEEEEGEEEDMDMATVYPDEGDLWPL